MLAGGLHPLLPMDSSYNQVGYVNMDILAVYNVNTCVCSHSGSTNKVETFDERCKRTSHTVIPFGIKIRFQLGNLFKSMIDTVHSRADLRIYLRIKQCGMEAEASVYKMMLILDLKNNHCNNVETTKV